MTTATITHPMRRGGRLVRLAAAVRTEAGVFRLAAGVVALHVADDNFLQPNPGRRPPTTSPAGSCPIALLVAAGVFYDRMRAGARATVALLTGWFGVLVGTEAVYYTREVGPSGDDYSGLLSIPAGLVLRRRSGSSPSGARARPPTASGGGTRGAPCLPAPPTWSRPSCSSRPRIAYVVTHALRAEVPPADLGAPYEDVAFTTSDGLRLEGWYIRSRNGAAVIAFPGRAGRAEAREDAGRPRLRRPALRPPRRGRERGRPEHPRLARRARHPRRRPLPPEPARRRSREDRRHRALRRWRGDDGRRRRVPVAQGDRDRGRQRPFRPRRPRERLRRPGHRRRTRLLHGRGRALDERPAADSPQDHGEAARGTGVLRLRRERPAGRAAGQRGLLRGHPRRQADLEVPGSRHMGGIDAQPAEYERRIVAFFDRTLEPSEGR